MNQAMESLLKDHDQMRWMLTCFDEQLKIFARAEQPDYEILSDSLAYCRDYLDQWHHPREDVMFDLLKARDPDAGAASTDLGDQHKHLAKLTLRVVGIFKDVADRGAVHLREDLVSSGRELSDAYRHHIEWEEENFFPLVEEKLTEADWNELGKRMAAPSGPLELNSVESRYRSLFGAIEAQRE